VSRSSAVKNASLVSGLGVREVFLRDMTAEPKLGRGIHVFQAKHVLSNKTRCGG
jgi:hypothetical protein